MPFLKRQIEIINEELRENSLKDKRFQSGQYNAIAVDVSRNNEGKIETFPAVMNRNYEAESVGLNDTYPIVIYHKILSKSYTSQVSQVGNGNKNQIEKTEVKMVVYGKYSSLKMTAEELEALITVGFPDSISKSKISGLKLDSMTVTLSSSNLLSAQVFAEEYKGFDMFLSSEDILFSVKYTIETRYRKGCFDICDCTNL